MNKKIIFLLLAFTSGLAVQAQIQTPKADFTSSVKNFIKPPAIGDVGKTTSGIMGELSSKLGLGEKEKPQLTDAIGSFLGKKKDILSLAGSNPTEYLAKFNPMQKDLFGKMKGIMGAAKFSKFLGLKPATAAGALSNLFF